MKRQHFGPFLVVLAAGAGLVAGLAAGSRTLAARVEPNHAPSFVQVSAGVTSQGNAVIHDVAIASLPGDPRTTFDVDGDRVTLTHYCDAR